MSPTVLVTGASGYLGQFVVESLAADGFKVRWAAGAAAALLALWEDAISRRWNTAIAR